MMAILCLRCRKLKQTFSFKKRKKIYNFFDLFFKRKIPNNLAIKTIKGSIKIITINQIEEISTIKEIEELKLHRREKCFIKYALCKTKSASYGHKVRHVINSLINELPVKLLVGYGLPLSFHCLPQLNNFIQFFETYSGRKDIPT